MLISPKAAAKRLKKNQEIAATKHIELDPNFPAQNDFVLDESRYLVAQCSRRAGKCRVQGTLVKTPTGAKPIESLKPGDLVYGYNSDGTVSVTKVVKLYDQGLQEVVDLMWNGRVLATSTLNHRWLAYNTFNKKLKVKQLNEFNSRDKIYRGYAEIPGGTVNFSYAYALGALLGDGCSRDSGLHISSGNDIVPEAISKELGVPFKRIHANNFTYSFVGFNKHDIPYYGLWCHNKYAHEKTCDINTIRTWDRHSQLRFIAGLIDTDGSITISKDGRLIIKLTMQAKSVIETVQMLLLDLFQVQARISTDNRQKYKNGPVYELCVSSNVESKRILKNLPTKVKTYKKDYDLLKERNYKHNFTGFTLENKRLAQCYDIEVDNDTHLFLDANGLVGHNTNGLAIRFFKAMEKYPRSQCLYIGLTRDSARDIMWPVLQEINDKYGLGCKFTDSTLTMTHPNGSKLRLLGADMSNFIKRLKGRKYPGVAIDEAQDFGPHIQSLVDDVLTPSISDYTDGWLALTGTPGPVPQGYFFDITENRKFGYNVHKWTLLENPYMPEPAKFIEELKKKREWDDNNPTLLREWRNKWVLDVESLWVRYKEEKNHFDKLPDLPGTKWNYLMGIDLGFKDADAIAVLAWNESSPTTYLVEECITSKQGITELVQQIEHLEKKYNVSKMVIDEGGLGKKIAEELRRQKGIPVHQADKALKQQNVEFLNDALRLGNFKAHKDSRFATDSYLVQIDWEKSRPDKIVIKKKPHSDIIDAVLYAFKESPAYTYQAPAPKPKYGSQEWAIKQEEDMFNAALEHFQEEAFYRDRINKLGFDD